MCHGVLLLPLVACHAGLATHACNRCGFFSGILRKQCRVPLSQVKIMKTHDPRGVDGPKAPLPDVVVVHTPKDDEFGFAAGGGKEGDKVSIGQFGCICIAVRSMVSLRNTCCWARWCSGGPQTPV